MGSDCFRVYGTLRGERERPLAGLRVRAFDRDWLRQDDEVGEALTDARGRFRIRFGRRAFSQGLERRPDLYLVVEEPRSGRVLASTARRVRWRARREELFSLQIAGLELAAG